MKIQHDFHIHTHLSACGQDSATLEHYLAAAKKLGLKKLGFSDHFAATNIPGARGFYGMHPFEHNAQLEPQLRELDSPELKLYFGCETEYHTPLREVGLTEEEAEKFDFVLVPNSHTHMIMPKDLIDQPQKHAEFMVQAYQDILNSKINRYITAMAHPFDVCCYPHDKNLLFTLISDDQYKYLFDQTAEKNIAFEINVAYAQGMTSEQIEVDPHFHMFRLAKECGCKFLFGSDSHDNKAHDFYENASIIATMLDLKDDDIFELCR